VRSLSAGPGDLVAALTPAPGPGAGAAFTDLVVESLRSGAALFPLDRRLAPQERARLLAQARPTFVIDGDPGGPRRVDAGEPVRPDVAVVMATSGSTGNPKLVELTRPAVDSAVDASLAALEAGPSDRWLCCLPLSHMGGLLSVLRALRHNSRPMVHATFDAAAVMADGEGAFVALVPTMLRRLLRLGCDLGRFGLLLLGGAPVPPSLAAEATAAGGRIVQTYGLTESCGGVVYDGSPLAGVGVRISGKSEGDGEGEVELGGPTLMAGYRLDPRATAARFTADGWLRTGDVGELGAEGRLRIHGRHDEVVITGGEKVWPAEVEGALSGHPQVASVEVRGIDDPEWGRRVVAYVVPVDPAEPPTLESLRAFASETVARYKAPAELVLVETSEREPRVSVMPSPEQAPVR